MLYFPALLISRLLPILLLFVLVPQQQQRGRRHTIEIHNHTKIIIDRIYVSSSTESSWGEDRLGKGVLNPDHYLPVEVPTGDYDFKITDRNKRECMIKDVTITEDTKVEVADKQGDLKCRVDNTIL